MAPFLVLSPLALFVPFLGGPHYRHDYNRLAGSTSTNSAADILSTIRQGIEEQLGEERLDFLSTQLAIAAVDEAGVAYMMC